MLNALSLLGGALGGKLGKKLGAENSISSLIGELAGVFVGFSAAKMILKEQTKNKEEHVCHSETENHLK